MAHPAVASVQLTMFGAAPRMLEPHDDGAGVLGDSSEDASATPDAGDGQIDLFTPIDARRRMKRLQPCLHARYMQRPHTGHG